LILRNDVIGKLITFNMPLKW